MGRQAFPISGVRLYANRPNTGYGKVCCPILRHLIDIYSYLNCFSLIIIGQPGV
jgi:hypothetical protein